MADKKISELDALTGAAVATDDQLIIVDTSAGLTKNITIDEFKNALDTATGFVRITGDTMTGDLDIQGTLTSDGLTVDGFGTVKKTGDGNEGQLRFTTVRDSYTTQWAAGQTPNSLDFEISHFNGSSWADKLSVDANGDISFYDSQGSSQSFFWDASKEKLEIGGIQGGADGLLAVKTNADNHAIAIEEASGTEAYAIGVESDGSLGFYNSGSTTASVLFDDSGQVGIGTSSPDADLHISGVGNEAKIILEGTSNPRGNFIAVEGADDLVFAADEDNLGTSSAMKFRVDATERMRIDSSGNLLVGVTSLTGTSGPRDTSTTAGLGVGVNYYGGVYAAAYQASAFVSNRISNDGELFTFKKDGTTVGSISSSDSGQTLNLEGNGTSGVRINASNASGYIRFRIAGSERMRIDSSGNVGIGTSSPATELDVQGTTTTNGLNLDAISDTIEDTAVDIFVYDTRKDSDGGAWRKRTQHTSWYNETLNTATRGSRKEFPAVAVIVAETNQVTIYDGDDPSLPMWMVFNYASGNLLGYNNITSIAVSNGLLLMPSGTYDLWWANFADDTGGKYSNTGKYGRLSGISERNTSEATAITLDGSAGIINRAVNDVAMTVLPNAPIDAATGLPAVTTAVATDGGVSVIKDDGTVVDSSITNGISSVSFTAKNALVYNRTDNPSSVGDPVQVQLTIPTADGFVADQVFGSATAPASNKWNNPDVVGLPDDDFAVGSGTTNVGFNYISNDVSAKTSGMTVQLTSEFNTGWMNGDIKLATLSDTDDTDVTGSELVTNGTFDTDTDWTKQTGWSISSGVATFSGTDYNYITQDITTVVGETYVATVEITAITTGSVQLRIMNGATEIGSTIQTTLGTHAVTFVATGTTTTVRVYAGFSGARFAGSVDNVSVRLAEEDRSVNDNGLQVFGSITKNPVATGADLVAYSGFSASNYLEQPYNSDLDFGTGDFCMMGWFKGTNVGTETIMSVGAWNGSGWDNWTAVQTLAAGLRFVTTDGSTFVTQDTTSAVDDGTWKNFVCLRQNGTMNVYINGEYVAGKANTLDLSLASNSSFRIGVHQGGANPAPNLDIALLRISATAPSPEQIARIYNDEKHLFTEGAQATLYGSSDSVTALAFDDTTNLLHVGTSAGRSVFQGLRRVDNTTTAVTSAISASNGLVADE